MVYRDTFEDFNNRPIPVIVAAIPTVTKRLSLLLIVTFYNNSSSSSSSSSRRSRSSKRKNEKKGGNWTKYDEVSTINFIHKNWRFEYNEALLEIGDGRTVD
ncbi:hypothetical protein DFA_08478 [Cavenderia fasciculata]|uniref:Uncharacterized protein n=1 Tax=Cavenderia fasciculata TaxID=261658 RepID=F4Q2L5_CACFS|nr:uncharacterized protein DFA_08478 [Cavenderia fasciculata]EGG17482.1 hypothetical protein DFA_08478 [Cavenderia fasciculata]|eukprot:XP_004355966.1 hypothetical protein DFA_08478 [Cavenderia fasciculata]